MGALAWVWCCVCLTALQPLVRRVLAHVRLHVARMPSKSRRSHRGYEKVATEDFDDDSAASTRAEDVPVPKVLSDFDPKVRAHCEDTMIDALLNCPRCVQMAKRLRRRDQVKKVWP